ncbi:membrane bound O-acyl transferase family-domain-containing protein, partial [Mycena rosella]
LVLISLVIKPSPYRQWFFVPLLFLSWRLVMDGQAGYLMSTVWFMRLLMSSDHILLTDVQRELILLPAVDVSRARRMASNHRRKNIENAPLAQRVRWAMNLFLNPRGVGWAHEPRAALSPPPPPTTPRTAFLARQLAQLFAALLVLDLANLHARRNPAFRLQTGLAAAGLPWRVLGTLVWAAGAAATFSLVHSTASIVCVALRVSRPCDWPPLFGSLADMRSVRTFWARGWHQLLRRTLSAHGNYFAHTVLRLPPKSTLSYCVKVCTGFALSGLAHYLSDIVAVHPGRSGSLLFFCLQPVAIALEMLVAWCAPSAGHWTLGYLWVFAWFALTLPIMQDPLIQAGELSSRVEVSLIMGLCHGTWVLPP